MKRSALPHPVTFRRALACGALAASCALSLPAVALATVPAVPRARAAAWLAPPAPQDCAAAASPRGTGAAGTPDLALTGCDLSLADAVAILRGAPVRASLAPAARERVAAYRAGAEQLIRRTAPPPPRVYGWNQALGPLKDKPISDAEAEDFQQRILHSHAVSSPPYLPERVARLALVIRANQMARGHMGVRPELPEKLLELVNKGVTPLLPQVGSLGSGDLQPMAAAGLVAIGGPGQATYRGETLPAPTALSRAGITPIKLQMGEALPIISGSTVVAASYADALRRAEDHADLGEGAFALFMEATRAEASSLDARTHAQRRIPEQEQVAARLRALVDGSELMTDEGRRRFNPADDHRVQDAVSVRAAPHIMASLRQALAAGGRILTAEMNASTSNPLVFCRPAGAPPAPSTCEFVMGGNWDGAVMGHALDSLNANVTDLGVLSQELSARLLSDKWSYGLNPNLAWGKPGLNSGMVQLQTVAAALIPEMQTRAAPSGVLSRPAKNGQEDHNTMAMASVRNLAGNLDRLGTVLAVQFLMSAQGVDLVQHKVTSPPCPAATPPQEGCRPLALGRGTGRIHREIRERIAPLHDDRYLSPDLATMTGMVNGTSPSGLLDAVRGGGRPIPAAVTR